MRIRYARLNGVVGREVSYCVRVRTGCPTQNTREHTTFVTTAAGAPGPGARGKRQGRLAYVSPSPRGAKSAESPLHRPNVPRASGEFREDASSHTAGAA
jgi:hypothetical protein